MLAMLTAASAPALPNRRNSSTSYQPGAGEWQVEYNGQFGTTDDTERQHSVEAFYGVNDRLAIGLEVEAEAEDGDFGFGEAGLSLLYRLNDAEKGQLGAGIMASARLDESGTLSEAEARLHRRATRR